MIEEAAGTRLYETKREAAQKTIEKKDAKLREMDSVSFFIFIFCQICFMNLFLWIYLCVWVCVCEAH